MTLKRPFLPWILAGLVTWLLVGGLKNHVPASPSTSAVFDALAFPGALVASGFYPQGIHTARGAAGWAPLVFCSNLVIYVIIWYAVLKFVGRRRQAG